MQKLSGTSYITHQNVLLDKGKIKKTANKSYYSEKRLECLE